MSDEDELLARLAKLEERQRRGKRDRQVILLMLGSVAVFLLAVKVQINEDGKRSFSFDGSAVNVELLLQMAGVVFGLGAAARAVTNVRSDDEK